MTEILSLRRLRWAAIILTWAMVALFLVWGGIWALRIGMQQRQDLWQSTRSIRFVIDIRGGFDFGSEVLRYAEAEAGLLRMSDALADQPPRVLRRAGRADLIGKHLPSLRRLTNAELLRGLVHYVDTTVRDHSDDQEYELDYTPLRLAIMTLWARHAERSDPSINHYPNQRSDDTSLPQQEDIAGPMLQLNAWCDAAAAALMFALVWLWVHRGWKSKAIDVPRGVWIVPHGIFVFMLATAGFWYAYTTLAPFPPAPTPVVRVNRLDATGRRAALAITINAQNADTRWRVQYGPTITYGHATPTQSAEAILDDQPFTTELTGLNPGQTVHFRIWASSSAGTTHSEDVSFVAGDKTIDVHGESAGGLVWPSWTVWLRLLALLIVMVVSAQILPPIHRGWACGAVAAMLLWFDPLNLIDSHVWPQWDVWILPVFLAATLLASVNWWMAAGIVIGIGCMVKGQLLLAAPMLVLWPLFEGKWDAAIRIVIGFLIGTALVTWPWIVNSASELYWIEWTMAAAAIIGVAVVLLGPLRRRADERWRPWMPAILFVLSGAFAAAVILGGIPRKQAAVPGEAMVIFLLLVLIPPWFLRQRYLGVWLGGIFACCVWIAMGAFGGSSSWLTLGFAYGSIKHDQMQMSANHFANLASILADGYNWDIHDVMGTLAFSLSKKWTWSADLDVKTTTAVLYGICLVIASAAAAIHSRRKDRRFLVALVVPWLAFPLLMCQMGARYPVWASAISAAMVAVSLELTLLHLVIAISGFAILAGQLLTYNAARWPQLSQIADPLYPGVAWMLLLVTVIFLVASLVPSRKIRFFSLR